MMDICQEIYQLNHHNLVNPRRARNLNPSISPGGAQLPHDTLVRLQRPTGAHPANRTNFSRDAEQADDSRLTSMLL